MLLNEFIYFNKDSDQMTDISRFDPNHDTSVLTSKDMRKTRLTLRMINDLRKAGDQREKEQKEELELVQAMYKTPAEPAQ